MEVGFLLEPAGVGVDGYRAIQKPRHVEIADRIDHSHALRHDARPGQRVFRARMYRKDDGPLPGLVSKPVHDGAQLLRVVGVLGPVDGSQRVAAAYELQALQNRRAFPGPGGGEYGRVIHHVADMMDACCDALALEIYDRLHRRTEQQGAEMVDEDAVDLLRHERVERP